MRHSKRKAFTLIEMVVVVMILGILVTIAVPKLINTSRVAVDYGLKQTLTGVRDAVAMFVAENDGTLPGLGDDLPGDLAPYLRGGFPACPVGPAKNATITYVTDGNGLEGDVTPTTGWKYDKANGDFICNLDMVLASETSVKYDEL